MNRTHPRDASTKALWAGRILTGLPVLFLIFDAFGKLLQPAAVVEGTVRLGFPASLLLAIGVVELAGIITYLVPRTAVLGAILLTGFLGGAVATHVRVGDPLLTHILFPVYVAALIWGGLFFREGRLRALIT